MSDDKNKNEKARTYTKEEVETEVAQRVQAAREQIFSFKFEKQPTFIGGKNYPVMTLTVFGGTENQVDAITKKLHSVLADYL